MADFAISTGEEKLRATQSHATDQHLTRHRGLTTRSRLQGTRLGLAQGAGFGWRLALTGTTLPLFFLLLPLLFSFSFLSSLFSFPFPGAFSVQSNGQWSMVFAGPLTIDHSALTSFLFLFLFLSFLFFPSFFLFFSFLFIFLPLPACSFRVPCLSPFLFPFFCF